MSNAIERATTSEDVVRKELAEILVEEPVFISDSAAVRELRLKIDVIARSSAPVFITGESGTGKEVIAWLIHQKSGKLGSSPVAINCAALPKDVIENELFGHEREAFTGAVSSRSGCFELANGGTLFLDEIGEMHPQVQAKLLRAIEQKSFRRLGGQRDVEVDVRIIAATNKSIPEALESGELREDLYYRLNVVELAIPPLRERKSDIPLLLDHFLNLFCNQYGFPQKQFAPESLEILRSFDWPGNVRELKNVIESSVLLCPTSTISPQYLPTRVSRVDDIMACVPIELGTSLAEVERIVIQRTLASVGDNKSEAARILGLSRKALYDKLRLYEGRRVID